ncbi:uncharacterized protein PHACADRAFT_181524 [Phanerochaete carnosa HHB-10118-sp]|uniref:Mediator of RNA polymerase II transcription subunit 13 n=1 Tax=Phanerochaete carnosa (strain HHB-10118-sp) TaxID=650164 RepID=K5V9L0_PHACS|nr:uncharacterized protein PHACADRAFT_181524 [Phanerochaete carnosa HHB-10118-sp]EKM59526.1 hypothetical protein PHACADRAFT_181524 [Phanerochaete carnosa HHB-10118-sp]
MKPALQPPDSTGLSALSQHPQRISLSSPILASAIDLPPNPLISCSVFIATRAPTPTEQLTAIENARRRIVADYTPLPMAQSLLPSVHVTKDRVSLYLFAFGSTMDASAAQMPLSLGTRKTRHLLQLKMLLCESGAVLYRQSFTYISCVRVAERNGPCTMGGPGLLAHAKRCIQKFDTYSFTPDGIYPCSLSCATQRVPCAVCIQQREASSFATPSSQASPTCSLPRKPLRLPLVQFIQAVRDRIIDDIVRSSSETSERWTGRLQGGFLLSPLSPADDGEWGAEWEHYGRSRPFVHCELQISLSQTRLVILPILRTTQYLPLTTSLSLPTGTPIVLLPHGTPAFYLNTYSGALGNLTHQFEDALFGLGVGNWKSAPVNESTNSPCYLIAWVSVQNKQGEEKGLPVIWPTTLSVLPDGTCPQARHKLAYLPDLPAQLLASPPAVPAQAPPITFPLSALNSSVSPLPSASDVSPSPWMTTRERPIATRREFSCPLSNHSPTSDSLRAFRSLTIGERNIHAVARDVSTYVDSIAKERERERERLKREREGSSSRVPTSPQKQEFAQSPIVAAGHEHGLTPAGVQQASLYATEDRVPLKREESPIAFVSWDAITNASTGDTGEPLPPIGVASPAGISAGMLSTDIADKLPGTVGLPSGEVEMVVDDDVAKEFDTFNGLDASWPQSSTDLMNMDMPLDHYNFAMDMSGTNNNESTNINVDDGFGMFTDDDFDFFDRPQPSSSHTSRSALPLSAAANPDAPMSAALRGLQTSGPGPPVTLNGEHPAPWTAHFGLEGLTPRSLPASTPGLLPAPELVPSTPLQTPSVQSGPATPTVMLDHHIHIRRSSTSSQGSINFDPIPFSPAHKAKDGKYTVGKFALPTPPPDDVERIWPHSRRSQEPSLPPMGWRFSYGSATDPRIAVVRRLVGAKRKRLGEDENGRDGRMSPAWMHEHEEWAHSPLSQEGLEGDSRTDSDLDVDEDAAYEDRSALTSSRSFTPPLSHLPLGPSLVATAFHHSYLLPLSTPLRPPGAVTVHGNVDIGAGPMSVPTPVSPAATLGTASERTRSLESTVQFLVKELVENPMWADAWHANLSVHSSFFPSSYIWLGDIRCVMTMLHTVSGMHSPIELGNAYNSDTDLSFRELDPPMFAVGKSDALMQVLPTALRFWEKLGLKPRSGNKDVTAFVFFEARNEAGEVELSDWLESLGQTYMTKNFGSHIAGRAAGCTRDGLVPVQFDSFRKTLVSFMPGLPDFGTSVVIYIVIPTHMITLASASLRQIFSAIRKIKKERAQRDRSLLFHLVPEPFASGSLDNPAMRYLSFETIVEAVYDRIPVLTRGALVAQGDRVQGDRVQGDRMQGDHMQALFQEPSFVLARPLSRRPTFHLEARTSTLDVMERFSILHVGYRVSPCGKWLLVACVDQRGEMHELKAWLVPGDNLEAFVVKSVWAMALNIAGRVNVEWRIAITKHGAMNELELCTWRSQLSTAEHASPPSEVLVLVADHGRPWTFLLPEHAEYQKPPKSPYRVHKQSPGTVLHEISSTSFFVYSGAPSSLLLDAPYPLSPSHPFVPDVEEECAPPCYIVRPLASATVLRVPTGIDHTSVSMLHIHLLHKTHLPQLLSLPTEHAALKDIARNYHDLSVLARHRWKFRANPVLPFHLAALEVISTALACDEYLTD